MPDFPTNGDGKLKIAMFGHKRIPSRQGGVEVVVGALSSRMAALGHQVVCYNRTGGADAQPAKLRWSGVCLKPVWTVDIKGLAAVSSSFFTAWACALGDADVVHIHAEGPAAFCWIPKLFGKRVVVTIHGLDWQRAKWANGPGRHYIRFGERMAVRFADEIIVLSRSAQAYFWETYGRECVWIPNGMEPARFAAAADGLEPEGYFLYLGRLVPEKGAHYLIEAFRAVKTDKKLVIAGSPSDTADYARQLTALAQGDERIVFTGFAGEELRASLYSHAYGYVLPSDLEGMPLGLLEAMAYGNCCLVSDIPACTEVVGQRGMVFPHGSVSGLRDAIQRLCDEPDLVALYRARAKAMDGPGWEEITSKTLEVYQSAQAGKGARLWPQRKQI